MNASAIPGRRLAPLPWWGKVLAWAVLALAIMALPMGYVLGGEFNAYPVPLKLALGAAGIAGGIGLLMRKPWARVIALAFLTTQLPRVLMGGFSYKPIVSFGPQFKLPVSGDVLYLGINATALVMFIGVAALRLQRALEPAPEPQTKPEPTPETREAGDVTRFMPPEMRSGHAAGTRSAAPETPSAAGLDASRFMPPRERDAADRDDSR